MIVRIKEKKSGVVAFLKKFDFERFEDGTNPVPVDPFLDYLFNEILDPMGVSNIWIPTDMNKRFYQISVIGAWEYPWYKKEK